MTNVKVISNFLLSYDISDANVITEIIEKTRLDENAVYHELLRLEELSAVKMLNASSTGGKCIYIQYVYKDILKTLI